MSITYEIMKSAAEESGLAYETDSDCRPGRKAFYSGRAEDIDLTDELMRFAELIAAAERDRLLAGYRTIATATDLQMGDGDLARSIAARMLGPDV